MGVIKNGIGEKTVSILFIFDYYSYDCRFDMIDLSIAAANYFDIAVVTDQFGGLYQAVGFVDCILIGFCSCSACLAIVDIGLYDFRF